MPGPVRTGIDAGPGIRVMSVAQTAVRDHNDPMRRRAHLRLAVVTSAAALVVAGCTAGGHSSLRTTQTVRSSQSPVVTSHEEATNTGKRLGAAGCAPASPVTAGPEIQGTGRGATLYGLIMTTKPLPIRTAEQVKIVWRMTGSGPLKLSIADPQGNPVALQWGPDIHSGSNYNRPGGEWGSGYLFTKAGCWHLHAQRTSGSADVWIRVRSS